MATTSTKAGFHTPRPFGLIAPSPPAPARRRALRRAGRRGAAVMAPAGGIDEEQRQAKDHRKRVEQEHRAHACPLQDEAAHHRPQAHAQVGAQIERVRGPPQQVFGHAAHGFRLQGAVGQALTHPHARPGHDHARKAVGERHDHHPRRRDEHRGGGRRCARPTGRSPCRPEGARPAWPASTRRSTATRPGCRAVRPPAPRTTR